uniref:Testis expressed 19 n=2 Tax=Otolemur garnettii TaxID=30611 RepID=H0XWA0_OTOGA
MCPPVSKRYMGEGMSYLHASWLYDLQHGNQLEICFSCFKAAFLDLKDLLESEDWEDEDWDPELMEHSDEGLEHEGSPEMEPSWGQDQWQPVQGDSQALGHGILVSGPEGSEEGGLNHHFVPSELNPQDAVPLGLGPEDADWTQALPWRLGVLPTCSHWPCSPPP